VANSTSTVNGGTGIFGSSGSVINSVAILSGNDGFSAASGVLAFNKAANNNVNVNANGSENIDADGASAPATIPRPEAQC
jgi:hypothetical protein